MNWFKYVSDVPISFKHGFVNIHMLIICLMIQRNCKKYFYDSFCKLELLMHCVLFVFFLLLVGEPWNRSHFFPDLQMAYFVLLPTL